ncbi:MULTISPECIES: LysR family transcriptional regulator ArgP [unclassified Leifsonia]|uniref:LysR family transcriptional regulator ArgP n=1 Tax=unclassified Leifsonia TaxID=2663824 RepID=UPI0006FF7FCF|nr:MULTISPECIES: LysR family transcriptional regulator ArgP [unclassified Leifsonia]KQX05406.1 chromosome replication initiation inhibitor protein [Leifsonia sp. Root1293]KRA09039.1 chromosome replication initiation inhibitor protein [Leifsonia sp. Root60]
MEIPLDLARTLLAVVDAGTLEAAARELRLTPSAVSQRVKALEQRLGRVLLVRSKPVRTTDAGSAVVRLARQTVLLEHDALAAVGLDEKQVTRMPLAVNADSLATWILPPLAEVAASLPVVFDLHREDQDYTAELLETGAVMAAVTSREAPVAGCTSSRLGAMRYLAVASPAFRDRWLPSRPGRSGHPDAAAYALAPSVYFDRRDDLQALALREYGVLTDPPLHYVPASADFARAVLLGMGWGMLPEAQCADALAAGELVRLHPHRAIDVPLYWQQWNLRSELLSSVADAVADAARGALRP